MTHCPLAPILHLVHGQRTGLTLHYLIPHIGSLPPPLFLQSRRLLHSHAPSVMRPFRVRGEHEPLAELCQQVPTRQDRDATWRREQHQG